MEELASLGKMIGDARVVALGEGDHFAAEPMLFRNRLLRYLVEQKGFTAIAIESGIVESRVVHDYVRGGTGELSGVLNQGITWTFDELPQNAALVRWMKDYNADARHARKINFYGFDVPGSPSNPKAKRGVGTALSEVLRFLQRVDSKSAAAFQTRLAPYLGDMHFDLYRPGSGGGYYRFTQSERDTLTAVIADLVAMIEARQAEYTAASTPEDYQWAERAAIGARQVDCWLRQVPIGCRATREQLRFLDFASDLRDRAQADNLDWIIRREGPAAKVLVYAHNGHLSKAPITWHWRPVGDSGGAGGAYAHAVAGTYLSQRLGTGLVTIGNLIGKGQIGSIEFTQTLEAATPGSADRLAQGVGVPRYLLDLRNAPSAAMSCLSQHSRLGRGFEIPGLYRVGMEVPVSHAFDVVFYLDAVTPCRAQVSGS